MDRSVFALQRISRNSRWIGTATFIATLFSIAFLVGCGRRDPERIIVSGKVTYEGKPLPDGTIRFMPIEASQVPGAGAKIVDGSFRADINGGVPVGTFKVVIEAFRTIRKSPDAPVDPYERPVRIPCIPDRYSNLHTPLEITVQSGSPEIVKDFQLSN